jgi:hypothetical protein
MAELLKLNLGCGANLEPGFINVDKFGSPDLLYDLEVFPWPWETSSVGEIRLKHVLEHLGATTEQYYGIIKEMYRVCAHDARIHIWVPHPRSNDFLNDPSHVRVVTVEALWLFSQTQNRDWIAQGNVNSPLGLYLGVDLEPIFAAYMLEEPWRSRVDNKEITWDEAVLAVDQYNNVAKEIHTVLKVIKLPATLQAAASE